MKRFYDQILVNAFLFLLVCYQVFSKILDGIEENALCNTQTNTLCTIYLAIFHVLLFYCARVIATSDKLNCNDEIRI